MNHKHILKSRIFLFFIFLLNLIVFLSLFPISKVTAQSHTPFLNSPFYGSKTITSYFDHEYPTYYFAPNGDNNPGSENGIFTRYDGTRWVPPNPVDRDNCDDGVNCYDGHDGIDFSIDHEPVIASASGWIIRAGWDNLNDRYDSYGLIVEIQHTNGYVTRYGHLSTIAVDLDQYVYAGQVVGTSGDTGNSSGPHLHFRVINPNDLRVDPFGWSGSGNDPWQVYSGAESWCMWSDGQWANLCNPSQPSHPIPEPLTSSETIVDDNLNNAEGFSKGRDGPFNAPCPPNNCQLWYPVATGYGNDMYYTLVNGDIADYWGKWQPSDLPVGAGLYEIFVYVPNENATSWQAPYTVVHGLGQTTAIVDQYGLNNEWVSIGVYELNNLSYVYTTDANGESQYEHCGESQECQLGIDAVKFVRLGTTYIPNHINDVYRSTDTIIRNNGGPARVRMVYYNSDGSFGCGSVVDLPARGYTGGAICPGAVSVVVDSTQDVSVSVLMEQSFPFASAAYRGITELETDLFVPLVYRNNNGWNNEINIHNAGPGALVEVEFFPESVGSTCTKSQLVEPNGTWQLYTVGQTCLGSTFIGSARITSTSPVAVVDLQYQPNYASLVSSSILMEGQNTLYGPLIQNNNSGWTSELGLQNAAANTRKINAKYFAPGGSRCRTDSYSVGPYLPKVVSPALPSGCNGDPVLSAEFSSNGIINTQVNQIIAGSNAAAGYLAIASPTTKAIVPYVRKDATWQTGLQIRNTSSGSASVTIRYYDSDGNEVGSENTPSINRDGFVSIYPVSPAPTFYGSAVVESTNGRNIAVVVNYLKIAPGASGDVLMSHIAPNR